MIVAPEPLPEEGGGVSEEAAQVLIDAAVAPIPNYLDLAAPSSNTSWGIYPGAGQITDNVTAFGMTDSTMYYMPFVPPVDYSFTEIICDVVTGGTALTIGCVELDPTTWQPKATGILGQGNLTASIGLKSLTGLTIELTAGSLYATFMIATGTMAMERIRVDQTNHRTPWFFQTGSSISALSLLSVAGATVGTQSDPMINWADASLGTDGMSICMLFRP